MQPDELDMYDEEEMQEPDETLDPSLGRTNSTVNQLLLSMLRRQVGVTQSEDATTINLDGISLEDLIRVFGSTGSGVDIRSVEVAPDEDEDEDEDDDSDGDYEPDIYSDGGLGRRWFSPHREPQEAGVELLMGGEFGRVLSKQRHRQGALNIAKDFLSYADRSRPNLHREDRTSTMVPNTNGTAVALYDANIYTGQFSADSSFYYTCAQDFKLHVYDMTAAPSRKPIIETPQTRQRGRIIDQGQASTLRLMKRIQGNPGRWTITDANLSPDNERMIYSSITPTVYMTNVLDDSTEQIPIPFEDVSRPRSFWGSENFGIWSCRFSADGNEVVAGGSGNLFVYDLLANRRTVKITAHEDDVNSCCWADTSSGNILVSASDDTFLKVWDRRSLGSSRKPSGVLIGHTEGITNVSAKGDGRYVISNGKDQAMRLWDLRKMCSSAEFEEVKDRSYGIPNFDYRYPSYPKPRRAAHPKDCSVMTFRGHAVLKTLIRCHFSPAETTGSQYVYSGSADGRIHIWSLDGRIVEVLDRSKTLPISFDPSGPEPESLNSRHAVCVRDVSWHSQEPVLMSAGWSSHNGGSIIARHEWKGLNKLHGSLEDWTEKKETENAERRRSQLGRMRVPGSFMQTDEEDDSEEEDDE